MTCTLDACLSLVVKVRLCEFLLDVVAENDEVEDEDRLDDVDSTEVF